MTFFSFERGIEKLENTCTPRTITYIKYVGISFAIHKNTACITLHTTYIELISVYASMNENCSNEID